MLFHNKNDFAEWFMVSTVLRIGTLQVSIVSKNLTCIAYYFILVEKTQPNVKQALPQNDLV